MVYTSGRVYEGLWVNDRREGNGYERYKNGDVYTGEFKGGRPFGKGRRKWADTGEVYDGDWYQGLRHGVGNWQLNHKKNAKKILKENYSGKFMNNHFEGYGIYTITYESGKDTYEGEWSNSTKQGNGV